MSGNLSSTQGVVANPGRVSRGGSADGGSETAQLAVMSGKAGHTADIQRCFSIMGTPGLGRGPRGRPPDRHGLVVKLVETPHLSCGTLDLESAGGDLRTGDRSGPSLRLLQSPPQTIAVPWRAAAALNAAAIRGYSGQSQRT
jgi:hypothetical protein